MPIPIGVASDRLHGRTRLQCRANEVSRADLGVRVRETPPETRACCVDLEDGVRGPLSRETLVENKNFSSVRLTGPQVRQKLARHILHACYSLYSFVLR